MRYPRPSACIGPRGLQCLRGAKAPVRKLLDRTPRSATLLDRPRRHLTLPLDQPLALVKLDAMSTARQLTTPIITSSAQAQLVERGLGCALLGQIAGATKQAASLWLRGQTTPTDDMKVRIAGHLGLPIAAWSYQPGKAPAHLQQARPELYIVVSPITPRDARELCEDLAEVDGVHAAPAADAVEVFCSSPAQRAEVCATLKRAGLHFATPAA